MLSALPIIKKVMMIIVCIIHLLPLIYIHIHYMCMIDILEAYNTYIHIYNTGSISITNT